MVWFDILKESRQISSTGIKTKLGTKPLTITEDKEDECCENAKEGYKEIDLVLTTTELKSLLDDGFDKI